MYKPDRKGIDQLLQFTAENEFVCMIECTSICFLSVPHSDKSSQPANEKRLI